MKNVIKGSNRSEVREWELVEASDNDLALKCNNVVVLVITDNGVGLVPVLSDNSIAATGLPVISSNKTTIRQWEIL